MWKPLTFLFVAGALGQTTLKLAVPLEPIGAILDAFKTHRIVALGEGAHGNEQGHKFRLSLIRDPRFATLVNDILVEFGNARYQGVMDQFVRGADIPQSSLRQVWQNTTNASAVWERPIYEEFFYAIRAANESLPEKHQFRVLLGDPPIDWDTVHNRADLAKALASQHYYQTDLLRREVLNKKRRALIIYGGGHLERKSMVPELPVRTIVGILENTTRTKVFSVWTNTSIELKPLQPDIGSWYVPSLALIRGTGLGATDFTRLEGGIRREWPTVRLEEQYDAILYLGPPSAVTFTGVALKYCSERTYMDMRLGRMALAGYLGEADRLKQYCAAAIAK